MRTSTTTTTTRKNPTTKQQIKTPTTKSNYRTPGASTTTNSTETGQTVTQQGADSSSRSSDISSSYRYEQGEQGKPVHTGGAPEDSGWNQGGGGNQAPAVAGSFNMDAYQAPPVNASSKSGSAVSRPSTSSSSPAASAFYSQPQAATNSFQTAGLSMTPDTPPQKAEEATKNWMDWMNRVPQQPVLRSLNPKDQPGYVPEYGLSLIHI